MKEIRGGVVSRFTYMAEGGLRAAGALWQSCNPDTELSSLEESERQQAWASAARGRPGCAEGCGRRGDAACR